MSESALNGGPRCPTCRTRQLALVDLTAGGEALRMASCSFCDRRWWQGTDGELTLPQVLHLVGTRRR